MATTLRSPTEIIFSCSDGRVCEMKIVFLFLPSRLRDDHFRLEVVKFIPQVLGLQDALDVAEFFAVAGVLHALLRLLLGQRLLFGFVLATHVDVLVGVIANPLVVVVLGVRPLGRRRWRSRR